MRFLLFSTFFVLFSCTSTQQKTKSSQNNKTDGKIVIQELEQAGFFDITEKSDLKSTKKEMAYYYKTLQFFDGKLLGDDSLAFTDHRFHFIDTEELFEPGGLSTYLKQVKVTFEKLGLKLDFKDENNYEELSIKNPNYWKHSIVVNNKVYSVFEGDITSSDSWDKAFVNFVTMLNDQLAIQGSKEQVYMIYGENEGQIVFLRPEMYLVVKKYYADDDGFPLTIKAWKKEREEAISTLEL